MRAFAATASIVMWLALWLACHSPRAAAASCQPATVAIDTSYGQDYRSAWRGGSVGESFLATDTLIRSISVWTLTPAGYTGPGGPMKLWITRTNESGVPLTYDGVLLQGPTMWTWRDSGEARPVRVKFNLDPPFALPGPGLYAFFVQDPCELSFSLLVDTLGDVYPAGHYWDTPRVVIGPCILRGAGYYEGDGITDLIFEIEFCREASTPVRRRSWGEVKVIYR